MLRSLLLAACLLALSNVLPPTPAGVPTASAAPLTSAGPPARTAVKHSAQMIGTGTAGGAVKFLAPAVGAPAGALTPGIDAGGGLRPEEREFIARINAERTSRGLNALAPDGLLTDVARGHSREMCDLDYFDHHSPTSGFNTPMDRYLVGLHAQGEATPAYLLVGENIYYCSVTNDKYNVQYGHQALMNSPGHRANILEPRFARLGVGVYEDSRGQFWVTELFLKDQD